MRKIFELSLVVVLTLFSSVVYLNAQEKSRIVQDLYLPKDAPVQITNRELKGIKLDAEHRGMGGADWIKHLTFEVKNVSKKNISYVEIMLMVPQQGEMPGPAAYVVVFGSRDGSDTNGLVPPEKSTKIKVRDSDFSTWERRFEGWGVSDFDRVLLQLRAVYYDDGTGWSAGRDLVQDPQNPKRWIHQDKSKPNFNLVGFLGSLLQHY